MALVVSENKNKTFILGKKHTIDTCKQIQFNIYIYILYIYIYILYIYIYILYIYIYTVYIYIYIIPIKPS